MNDAQKRWFRQRVNAIHRRVTAYDVLRLHGINIQSEEREEQFSCPFHGEDKKPSARVYPEREDNPSHVWCFVCQESGWDAIGLWKKFNNVSFGQALHRIERQFDLPTPETIEGMPVDVPKVDERKEAFKRLYVACELRIVACKPAYQAHGDLKGYLTAGSILDRTKYRVDHGLWPPERGSSVLQTLLARILEKTTACLAG